MHFDPKDKLLIISPHTDDEVLGCGGLMHHFQSEHIYVAQLTAGNEIRRREFESVMQYCRIPNYSILFEDHLHLKLDTLPLSTIIHSFEAIIEQFKPSLVAIPFPSFNQDHEVVFRAGMAALRSKKRAQHFPKMVILYEYPQINWISLGGRFQPNLYLDISNHLTEKIEMLKLYESQLVDEEYAVSIDGMVSLAKYRGKEISVAAAEAYEVRRWII